jgi:hypothetical protein
MPIIPIDKVDVNRDENEVGHFREVSAMILRELARLLRRHGQRRLAGDGRLDGRTLIAEELPAQAVGLVAAAGLLRLRGVADRGGLPRGLDAVGPLDLPGGGGRPLDQELLDDVVGLEGLGPGVEPAAEGLGVLAGQDGVAAVMPCLAA